jgi:hypothetical protein
MLVSRRFLRLPGLSEPLEGNRPRVYVRCRVEYVVRPRPGFIVRAAGRRNKALNDEADAVSGSAMDRLLARVFALMEVSRTGSERRN